MGGYASTLLNQQRGVEWNAPSNQGQQGEVVVDITAHEDTHGGPLQGVGVRFPLCLYQSHTQHMNKIVVKDCLKHFESIDVDAYEEDGSVYVHVGFEVYVEISKEETAFRADQWNEL